MILNDRNVSRVFNIVILGGGPDIYNNKELIKQYIKVNNSTVISANKEYFDIKSDYVVLKDPRIIKNNLKKTKCKIITKNRWSNLFKNHKKRVYTCCTENCSKEGAYSSKEIVLTDGELQYRTLGNAGFFAMAVSLVFHPLEILLAGFDGFFDGGNKKLDYTGKIVNCGPKLKRKLSTKTGFLENSLIPSLAVASKVFCFKTCALWGINKEKSGIIEI